ncbi:MAG: biotin-dependent carboxyltransferase [Deltaproteobacteria bacterium]|nr:biotin-dependent carboxyltransferase [Deltaproteobacteria bacterium]
MEFCIVERPGSLTTVQDKGRYAFLDRGVPLSGALDLFAFDAANLLVGNDRNAAALEITVIGPKLRVLAEADIALTGADMAMTINERPAAGWQSMRVREGDIIKIPKALKGCRAYLAVSGGIDVPLVMGSRSTYLKGAIGGYCGRRLMQGDVVKRGAKDLLSRPRRLPDNHIPRYSGEILLRAVPGPQDDFFTFSIDVLFASSYRVTSAADRMGYRLCGAPVNHDRDAPPSIISEASVPGSVQIPPDGQPIILLVEQTSGGYSKAATVISVDIPEIAQAVPGATVRFERVTLNQAHDLCRKAAALRSTLVEAMMDR